MARLLLAHRRTRRRANLDSVPLGPSHVQQTERIREEVADPCRPGCLGADYWCGRPTSVLDQDRGPSWPTRPDSPPSLGEWKLNSPRPRDAWGHGCAPASVHHQAREPEPVERLRRRSHKRFIRPVYNTTQMAKTVQLSDKAYACLTAEKGDRESYSDVVLRLTGEKDPMRFVGRLKIRKDFDEIMATMRRAEARSRRRLRT